MDQTRMFPTMIVDDFFEDPDRVVELANSLEYYPTSGQYPGLRSDHLHKVAPDFFSYVSQRWLSLYFDVPYTFEKLNAQFQIIEPFDSDDSSPYNTGWVHKDDDYNIVTAIVYLTKDANPKQGTSICTPLEDWNVKTQEIKPTFFRENNRSSEYEQMLRSNNEAFTESIVVDNYYNRMISFDYTQWHKARSFHNDTNSRRLTLVMFCNSIYPASPHPIVAPIVRKDQIKWSKND